MNKLNMFNYSHFYNLLAEENHSDLNKIKINNIIHH